MTVVYLLGAIVLTVVIAALAATRKRRPDIEPNTAMDTVAALSFVPLIWIAPSSS